MQEYFATADNTVLINSISYYIFKARAGFGRRKAKKKGA